VRLIRTEGWLPIDATLKVGAIAGLVRALGGAELYGMNLRVPLRELVQNASDAIRARRLLEDYPDDWGAVSISAGSDGDGSQYVEVTDNGVGMSVAVVSGQLLDFGASLWGSPAMHSEFPGLESKGFESAGQFGIGFFSSFMWGESVRVRTRRYEASREDTWVLEFSGGLHCRPILRRATPNEVLKEGGTSVRVTFGDNELWTRLWGEGDTGVSPKDMIARLCPTVGVTIEVSLNGSSPANAVRANDWLTMPGEDLLMRIKEQHEEDRHEDDLPSEAESRRAMLSVRSRLSSRLELILDSDGNVVGRGCLVPGDWEFMSPHGAVTVGGFRASTLQGFAGVLLGKPATAARSAGIPLLEGVDLAEFASREAQVLTRECQDPAIQASAAYVVYAFGGDPGELKIVRYADGWLNSRELIDWARSRTTCVLAASLLMYTAKQLGAEPVVARDVLVTPPGWTSLLSSAHFDDEGDWLKHRDVTVSGKRWLHTGTLEHLIYSIVARAWGSDVMTLLTSGQDRARHKIASVAGRTIKDYARVIERHAKPVTDRKGRATRHSDA
jgi:hypothetical protein